MADEVKDINVTVDTSKYEKELADLKEMVKTLSTKQDEKKSELKGEVVSSEQPSMDWKGYVLEESAKGSALFNVDITKNPKYKRLSRL